MVNVDIDTWDNTIDNNDGCAKERPSSSKPSRSGSPREGWSIKELWNWVDDELSGRGSFGYKLKPGSAGYKILSDRVKKMGMAAVARAANLYAHKYRELREAMNMDGPPSPMQFASYMPSILEAAENGIKKRGHESDRGGGDPRNYDESQEEGFTY